MVKNPAVKAGDIRDMCSVPGWGRPPEGDTATHSRTLAWRIPRTEEPGGLQSRVTKNQTQLKKLRTHAQ